MERSGRKVEHIQLALQTGQSGNQGMDELSFLPNSLPNISYDNTRIETSLGPIGLPSPVLINAMTGGADEAETINRLLAIVAREKGLAMAVGSQMAALRDPQLIRTYRVVRTEYPDGIILANLGAEATLEQAKRAVEMIEANALQIHLNVMQELLMPEGDRSFSGYLHNIAQLAEHLDVPVIVKEVGFGMSRHNVRQLVQAGVKIIDLGGRGGTNFALIENRRHDKPLAMFEDWGLTTVQSLLEAGELNCKEISLIASGGIRHGLDAAKALALGASAVGMAGYFLRLVTTQPLEVCLEAVDRLHHQLRVAMTALGIERVAQFRQLPLTMHGETLHWAHQRGIDVRRYACRDLHPDVS